MVRIQEEARSEPPPKVPRAGLEPARPFGQQILSLQCLPIPPPRQLKIQNLEASAGFEPANNGFANRSLKPLGYDANFLNSDEI